MRNYILQISLLIQFSPGFSSRERRKNLCRRASIARVSRGTSTDGPDDLLGSRMKFTDLKSDSWNFQKILLFLTISYSYWNFLRFFCSEIFFYGAFPEWEKIRRRHDIHQPHRAPKRPQRIFETLTPNGRFARPKRVNFRKIQENYKKSPNLTNLTKYYENCNKFKETVRNRKKIIWNMSGVRAAIWRCLRNPCQDECKHQLMCCCTQYQEMWILLASRAGGFLKKQFNLENRKKPQKS